MTSTRKDNWASILATAIADAEEEPFAWGSCDCCLWAADVVHAMTGVDFAAPWRGAYTTERGAARALKRRGGDVPGALAMAAETCGYAEIAPLCAQRGDLMLVATPHGWAAGICEGARAVCKSPDGLTRLPLTAAARAWRV